MNMDEAMMKPNRPAGRLVLSALLLAAFAACSQGKSPGPTPIMNSSELDGLRSTIPSVSWQSPDALSVGYKLEWVTPNKSWILKDSEPLNVVFRDTAGKKIATVVQTALFDPAFAAGTVKEATTSVTAKAPQAATTVSVALGTSGLETAETTLPKRP